VCHRPFSTKNAVYADMLFLLHGAVSDTYARFGPRLDLYMVTLPNKTTIVDDYIMYCTTSMCVCFGLFPSSTFHKVSKHLVALEVGFATLAS